MAGIALGAFLFSSDFLNAGTGNDGETHQQSYSIPKSLSEGAQGTLSFFNQFHASTGKKLFSVPESGNADDFKARHESNETDAYTVGLNEDVKKQYEPTIRPIQIGDVSVLEITPKNWAPNNAALVYLHGGGFVLNSAVTQLIGAVPMADMTGMKVYIPDYTVAPVAKHNEILAQVASVLDGLEEQGLDMRNVGIYGDSAGANLAITSTLHRRDLGKSMPGAVVSMSGWLDVTGSSDLYGILEPQDPILSDLALKNCALAYAPADKHQDPYVSPVFADYTKGWIPTLLQVGTKDMLLGDSTRLHQKLTDAGQTSELDIYEGMWHDFAVFASQLPESQKALLRAANFFKAQLASN